MGYNLIKIKNYKIKYNKIKKKNGHLIYNEYDSTLLMLNKYCLLPSSYNIKLIYHWMINSNSSIIYHFFDNYLYKRFIKDVNINKYFQKIKNNDTFINEFSKNYITYLYDFWYKTRRKELELKKYLIPKQGAIFYGKNNISSYYILKKQIKVGFLKK